MPHHTRSSAICLPVLCTTLFICSAAFAEGDSFFSKLVPAGSHKESTSSQQNSIHGKIRSGTASAEDYITFAGNLRKSGNADDAADVLHKAQIKYPDNTEILRQLGIAMIDANHAIQAIEVFDVLAAIEPKNAMAYNGKAVAFDTAGNHTAALEIYEKALSLDPSSVPIRNNMAMSMILNNQLEDARVMLEALHKEVPEIAKVRHNLALVYGLQGNKAKAMELNLQTLSQKQAEENLKFYQHYITMQSDVKPVDLMTSEGLPLDDLFSETPPPAPEVQEEKITKVAVPPAPVTEASPSAGSTAIEDKGEDAESTPSITKLFGDDAEYVFPTGRK